MSNPSPSRITASMWRLWTDRPVRAWLLGGIYAHKSGYHNTRSANQANWPNNYSIRMPLDQQGPSDKAAAIDYTMSDAEMRRRTGYLRDAAASGDPRLAAVREFYGTLNSSTVFGRIKDSRGGAWRASSADSSHLWHIHISFFRAYVNTWAELEPVLSVLAGESLATWQARRSGGAVAAPSGSPPLRVTDPMTQEPRVGRLQRALNDLGESLVVDNWYGGATEAAVMRLQTRAGIKVDGIYGPQSQQALAELLAQREETSVSAEQVWGHRNQSRIIDGDPPTERDWNSTGHQMARSHQYGHRLVLAMISGDTRYGRLDAIAAPGTEEAPRPTGADDPERQNYSWRYAIQRIWRWAFWGYHRTVVVDDRTARIEAQVAAQGELLAQIAEAVGAGSREELVQQVAERAAELVDRRTAAEVAEHLRIVAFDSDDDDADSAVGDE